VYYGDNTWRAKVRDALLHNFPKGLQPRAPIFRVGSVASSNTLIKDTQLLNQWKSSARAITHVEMELGGVYEAARRIERTYPVLAIRGISDIVGYKRSAEWTEYACQSAAAFTYKLLNSGLINLEAAVFASTSTTSLTAARDQLFKELSELPPPLFGRVLFNLRVRRELIVASNAPQAERTNSLLEWAENEAVGGCGLDEVRRALDLARRN
jgi:hypothetical protein